MSDNIFISLLLNVGLLVLVAATLTKIPVVRRLLVDGKSSAGSRVALSLIFGMISIFSTYTGIRTQGAIVNTRVIGVLAAGLLAGPWVGIGAAVIAGVHRYFFDIGGFTAVSCALSTLVEGFLGAYFSHYFRKNNYNSVGVFLITVLAEICQMAIILLVSRPFDSALHLVNLIAFPMITLNAFGMVLFIATFHAVFLEENNEYAGKMQLALHIAKQSLPHLRKGLYSRQDMEDTVSIIFESLTCCGVFITDLEHILARKVTERLKDPVDMVSALLTVRKDSCETILLDETSPDISVPKGYLLTAAPLTEMNRPIGRLVVISKKQWNSSHVGTVFVTELANLFSTQLELGNMEYQKCLLRKAELRALQSQVNPHFLYNALNTVSYVCRDNPGRARELLLSLSTYYRQTLEQERYILNLHTELYQINLYLELEKARFEEKLQVEILVTDDTDCMVPAFILQPLVENAIRYGADRNGIRFVKIKAEPADTGILISVSDRGLGIPSSIIKDLDQERQMKGFGLQNVHRRLKSIYGEKNGLTILSSHEGTTVSFPIPNEPVELTLREVGL